MINLKVRWGGSKSRTAAEFDLFDNYPADGFINSKRGNSALGIVSSPTLTTRIGAKIGACSLDNGPGAPIGECFEPPDDLKGSAARAFFYMSVRYRGEWVRCGDGAGAVDCSYIRPWLEAVLRYPGPWPPRPPPLRPSFTSSLLLRSLPLYCRSRSGQERCGIGGVPGLSLGGVERSRDRAERH